jgi:carbonic anhydrase/acetyltransferase-like protein (isoleucine patch superfamily)
MSTNVTILPYEGKRPSIDKSVFLADGVRIVGDVTIGTDSSVWYNTVIRGDIHYVRIGRGTNIQDLSVLHVTHETNPLEVGDQVTVGHGATLHGCTLMNRCLIGMGAIVLDGAIVEEHALVAAGAVVPPGMKVPSGSLVAGVPARVIRELTETELAEFVASSDRYIRYARKQKQTG